MILFSKNSHLLTDSNMKRTIQLIAMFLVCSFSSLYAQHATMNQQQFREHQRQYLTEKAQLTPKEAKAFFPLYFELQNKKRELNKEAWGKLRRNPQQDFTESEYGKLVDDVARARVASDQLEYEYIQKYKEVLSAKKIYRIQRAEMHFHRDLLKCFKQGRKGNKCPAE